MMESTSLASPNSIKYLSVDSSVNLTTTSDNSIDSGTETESHRSPSDSEIFDGKSTSVFPCAPQENTILMDTTPAFVIPPPPCLNSIIPPPPSLLIPPPPSLLPPPLNKPNFTKSSSQGNANSRTTKLRRLNWEKIPDIHIRNAEEDTIWGGSNSQKNGILVDFKAIDDLFALEEKPVKRRSPSTRSFNSTPVGDSDSSNPEDGKVAKIGFLDSKRSLNINIFLRQFKRSTSILAESIKSCDVSFMNSDKLRALRKLLPDKEELKILQEYSGNTAALETAEDFLLKIISIPFYQIRIDSVLLREEFDNAMSQVEKSIKILQDAMTEIRRCYALPTILHLVLQAGNYLNQGAAFGNASGFRLASLKAITDTKTNKPGFTLMHYVAMELEKHDPNMMSWVSEVQSVDQASRISEEEIREEIVNFRNRVKSLKSKVMGEVDDDLKENVGDFLEKSEQRLNVISEMEKSLKEASQDLGTYLCERSNRFSLNSCFQIVAEFRNKFKKATEENLKREKANNKKRLTSQSLKQPSDDSVTNLNQNNNSVISDQHKKQTTDENDNVPDLQINPKTQNFGLRRSRSMATPHQRFQGIKNTDDVNNTSSLPRQSRMRKHDASFTRRTSIAKPSPEEIIKIYEKETLKINVHTIKDRIDQSPKEAWVDPNFVKQTTKDNTKIDNKDDKLKVSESPSSGLLITRHKRRHMQRSRSLRGGLWNDYQDENGPDLFLDQLNKNQKNENAESPQSMIVPKTEIKDNLGTNNDDLEASFDQFVDRERSRMFERTQLRRSYMCIPRCQEDSSEKADSDSEGLSPMEVRRRMWQRRSSPLASKSEVTIRSKSTSRILSQEDDVDPYSSTATSALEATENATTVKRHEDIRERIRRYKESTSSNEDLNLDRRRSSSGSSLIDYSIRRKDSGADTISFLMQDDEETSKKLSRRNTYNGSERAKKSSVTLLPPMHENENEETPTNNVVNENIKNTKNDLVQTTNSESDVFESIVELKVANEEETALESSDLVSDIDTSATEDKSNTIPRRRKSSLYKSAQPPPSSWRKQSNLSPARTSSQSTISPDSSPDRKSVKGLKTTPQKTATKPPSGLRSPSKASQKTLTKRPNSTSPTRRLGPPAVDGVKSFIRNLTIPKRKTVESSKSKLSTSLSVASKELPKKILNSKSGTDSAYSDNNGDSTDCDVILLVDVNETKPVRSKQLSSKPNTPTRKLTPRSNSPAPNSTKKSVLPSPNRTPTKKSVIPKKEAGNASKRTQSPSISSASNLNRTARLRQNKLQQPNQRVTKSPQRTTNMVKPASHVTSLVKKTTKPTVNPKRTGNISTKKIPATTTVPVSKKSSGVSASKSKLPKKTVANTNIQIKVNGNDVVDSTAAVDTGAIINETECIGNVKTHCEEQTIKETNLNDLPVNVSLISSTSDQTTSSLLPRSGVQLNRAARLRLSKRMAQSKATNKAVFV